MLPLPTTLTAREARDAQALLAQGLQREPGPEVVVDASNLRHFDSAALAVLLECRRLAEGWGKAFRLSQAPAQLAALAKLYGVDALLLPD